MAKQKIVWTVLPYGRVSEGPLKGRLRVSVVVSPRLTPDTAAEQKLGASAPPSGPTGRRRCSDSSCSCGGGSSRGCCHWNRLSGIARAVGFAVQSRHARGGFVFKDMSRVNLRSFPVRNVLGFVREHYGKLAVAAATHPTLLPWEDADPSLKGMLSDAGTRTYPFTRGTAASKCRCRASTASSTRRKASRSRWIAMCSERPAATPRRWWASTAVAAACRPACARCRRTGATRPANGHDAALMAHFQTAGEYTLYQANRFYKRSTPSDAQLAMRRPT